MEIQSIKKEDFNDIVELWNQEYKHLTSSKKKISIKKFGGWYDSRDKTGYIYHSIKQDGKFAGFIFIQKKGKKIFIKAVAIKKNYRSLYLGKKLLEKAIEVSKAHSLPLMTEVLIDNIDAVNWFIRNKFYVIKFNKRTFMEILIKYVIKKLEFLHYY